MASKARELAELIGNAGGTSEQVLSGRRNLIINGAMQVAQRGTSFSNVSAANYTLDRYKYWVNGATVGVTQNTLPVDQTSIPSLSKYMSISVGANSASDVYALFEQHIEDVTTTAGQTVTVSFYAKASSNLYVAIEPTQLWSGAGGDNLPPTKVQLFTTWQRYSVSFDIPAIPAGTSIPSASDSRFVIGWWMSGGSNYDARTDSLGNQEGTFDITGVQLELGSVATPFEHRSYGEELALCQRYYQHHDYVYIGLGSNTTAGYWQYQHFMFPTVMRAVPTMSYTVSGGSWPSISQKGALARDTHSMYFYTAHNASHADIYASGVAVDLDAEL